jgi:SAM-dependent methyltransferase
MIKEYWEKHPCGVVSKKVRYSKEWFDEIEEYRYTVEPEIHAFAQFTRWAAKSVFEFGSGMGTDGKQFQRAGAEYDGHDLTYESTLTCHRRGLNMVLEIDYLKTKYDLVYSWGVIHHTPDPEYTLQKLIKLMKPGGTIKIMVYNRHSVYMFWKWLKWGCWRFKSFKWVLAHHQESPGTQAFTLNEMREMFERNGLKVKHISARVTYWDLMKAHSFMFRWVSYILACLLGFDRAGWFLTIEGIK